MVHTHINLTPRSRCETDVALNFLKYRQGCSPILIHMYGIIISNIFIQGECTHICRSIGNVRCIHMYARVYVSKYTCVVCEDTYVHIIKVHVAIYPIFQPVISPQEKAHTCITRLYPFFQIASILIISANPTYLNFLQG